VNVGLQNWNALRSSWKAKPVGYNAQQQKERRNVSQIDVDEIFNTLLSSSGEVRLPLPDLVAILVDIWEVN